MTISNEAVEAANAAFNRIHATCEDAVRAAIEAAEPFITSELRAKLAEAQTERDQWKLISTASATSSQAVADHNVDLTAKNADLHSQSLAMIALRAKLARIEAAAKEAVQCFFDLQIESQGVYGLHLNGDLSPWPELSKGGRFEEWTAGIDALRDELTKD